MPACVQLPQKAAPARLSRTFAVGATGLVHALMLAAIVCGWHHTAQPRLQGPAVAVTTTLPAPDQPRHHAVRGGAVSERASDAPAVPVEAEPAPVIVLGPPAPAPGPLAALPPAKIEGGLAEEPQDAAQAYRRAIMSRLEAQRRYPEDVLRKGHEGAGAIQFRIERSGRLLDVHVEASTGRDALDRAALGIVRRAAPFPAIPDPLPDELAITLPVEFLIADPTQRMALR